MRGQSATLQLDIFNAANFVNRSWGRILLPAISPDFPQQAILNVRNRQAAPLSSETANGYEFDNRVRTGNIFQPAPNRTSDFYQLQLTLRLAF